MGEPLILAIETSCDETAAAVLRGGRRVLSSSVHSQISIHQKYGGVVPEIASRSHVERVGPVVKDALDKANVSLRELDAIAVTNSPGLIGALLVGLSYAKGLACALNIPLVAVNHIEGHIAGNYLTYDGLEPPFVCLVASGGHSHILLVKDYDEFELLGRTIDDAAGEAFDKVARTLGLDYPGGPNLEKLAGGGNPLAYDFNGAFNKQSGTDFSFSGIKTAVINALHNAEQKNMPINKSDVAASFQHCVADTLTRRAVALAGQAGIKTLALAGGVAANKTLRNMLELAAKEAGMSFCCPDFRYCTDNAAMIGCAGYYYLLKGKTSNLNVNAYANSSHAWR